MAYHHHDDVEPSNEQFAWKAIAATARDKIKAKLQAVDANTEASDLAVLIESARQVYFLDLNAATYDHQVALELQKETPD